MIGQNRCGSRFSESSFAMGPVYIVHQTAENLAHSSPKNYVDRRTVGLHMGIRCLGRVFSRDFGLPTYNPGWLEHTGRQSMQSEQLIPEQGEL